MIKNVQLVLILF